MKKYLKYMITACLIFIPFRIFAKEGIENYYMNMDVMTNGDVKVQELFILNGQYNGYERIINYRNASAPVFHGDTNDFNGSDIYNGDAIEIISVKGISVDDHVNFDYLTHEGSVFEEVSYASSGDYGVYEKTDTSSGTVLKIYNPSKYKNGFYVEYIIKNMGIVHNDIAEVGFNIFSNEQREYIHNLEMLININGNKKELRAWGHGPLWGETQNINKNQIKLTIHDVEANTAFDIRFVFDKGVLNQSQKITDINALDKILTVEKQKADDANELREQYRNHQRNIKIFGVFGICLIIGLVIMIIHVYRKYDKEYKSLFTNEYFRDFPSSIDPEYVGYLMHKRIDSNELSASILNLIYKKKIGFKELGNDNFKLELLDQEGLNEVDLSLIKFLFHDKKDITLKELKKSAKNSYSSFLNRYSKWKQIAKQEAEKMNFFENNKGIKTLCSVYCVMTLIIGFSLCSILGVIGVILVILSIITLCYLSSFYRRTKEGNEEYHKWLGLKKFMNDFGNFKERELPEIALWEKYLVYAVVFGCASKLAKTMEIKMREIQNTPGYTYDPVYDYNRIHFITTFNREIDNSIHSAISSANAQRIAESSNSSSGGFGGGFSGGGGSFGGGGGGGRF